MVQPVRPFRRTRLSYPVSTPQNQPERKTRLQQQRTKAINTKSQIRNKNLLNLVTALSFTLLQVTPKTLHRGKFTRGSLLDFTSVFEEQSPLQLHGAHVWQLGGSHMPLFSKMSDTSLCLEIFAALSVVWSVRCHVRMQVEMLILMRRQLGISGVGTRKNCFSQKVGGGRFPLIG